MQIWQGLSEQSADEFQDEMMARGLGDGLPVVAPSAQRVERMLAHRWHDPDEVLCQLAPLFASVTWRDVAINAVMAGCKPEYLPIVGAAVQAMAEPEFNLIGVSTTTGSAATLVIVNGPIARTVGMNAEANVLGPGNRANATIGRAARLVLQNVGGAKAGEIDMATLGQPAKFTFCLAENEAGSPWQPLHVERGFGTDQSVVTVVGTAGIVEVVDSSSRTTAELAQTFAHSTLIAGTLGGGGLLGGGEPLIIIPPELATLIANDARGKSDFKQAIWERAVMSLEQLSPPIREHLAGRRGLEPVVDPTLPLRIAERAGDLMIVVAGGIGIKAAYVPTWGGSTRAVSRVIPGA